MKGSNGMIFELITGLGTIFFLIFLWVLLSHPLSLVATDLKNRTPTVIFNKTVNNTAINSKIDLGYNIFYFSLLFITLVIFVYEIKLAQEQSAKYPYVGGG